jgi:hypothetical protein
MPERRVGWQPSRFLTDRGEAERAFQLAQQLGSVITRAIKWGDAISRLARSGAREVTLFGRPRSNAAAQQLGTTWPSLRKAFIRHSLGMPTRNPEAVR